MAHTRIAAISIAALLMVTTACRHGTPRQPIADAAASTPAAGDPVPTADKTSLEEARLKYPAHWWAPISKEGAPSWEIMPQEAGPGEVILSKRHELGLLSNFAPTPFTYRGKKYASLEGYWQMMLYPEDPDDPRAKAPGIEWKYTREQVSQMTAFDAKGAGDLAKANMKTMGITWASFEGKHFEYKSKEPGEHYKLIVAGMREKVTQNPEVKKVLLSTGDLILKPDHHQDPNEPPEWRYFDIMMQIRGELQSEKTAEFLREVLPPPF